MLTVPTGPMRSSAPAARRSLALAFRTSRCLPVLSGDTDPLQVGQPEQVVGRAPKIGHLLDFPASHMAHLAQPARLFQPAEDLLHFLARLLADPVAEQTWLALFPTDRYLRTAARGLLSASQRVESLFPLLNDEGYALPRGGEKASAVLLRAVALPLHHQGPRAAVSRDFVFHCGRVR